MNPLKIELEKVLASGRFTTVEAKHLMGLDWHSLTSTLPTPARQETDVLYHFILGSIEEVEEGFIDDQDDAAMRARIKKLLPLLPDTIP